MWFVGITLFGDNEFADDGLAVVEGELHGVVAFGEVGEVHDGFVAKVVVDENFLAKGIEDGNLGDAFGTLNVELSNGGVGVEGDVGGFGVVDTDEGNDGNPAGVVAGIVGSVGEGGFKSDVYVALYVVDAEGVFAGGLVVAVGPFIGGAGSAGGIEDGGFASVEVPVAVDGGDDR